MNVLPNSAPPVPEAPPEVKATREATATPDAPVTAEPQVRLNAQAPVEIQAMRAARPSPESPALRVTVPEPEPVAATSHVPEPRVPHVQPPRLATPATATPVVEPVEAETYEADWADEVASAADASSAESVSPPIVSTPETRARAAAARLSVPRETTEFVVENEEAPEISLSVSGDRRGTPDTEIQVIAYGDANAELRAGPRKTGESTPDDLEFEETELSLEPSRRSGMMPSDLQIESFWTRDAMAPTTRSPTPVLPPTPVRSSTPVLPPTPVRSSTPVLPPTPVRAATPVRPSIPAVEPHVSGLIESLRASLDSLTVEDVAPPHMPTPAHVRSVTPRVSRAFTPNFSPRMTTPADLRGPGTLEALKEQEPWALPATGSASVAARHVAEALERVARRIRSGDVNLPADAPAATDENALSAALQAIVRAPRR